MTTSSLADHAPANVAAGSAPAFADIVAAVAAAPELPEGSRKNLINAVRRAAELFGADGLQVQVDIAELRQRLEKLTAAKLGFRSEGSFSSFRSNLNRALRLGGLHVMPGKSRPGLSGEWLPLRDRAEKAGIWPALSRFAHWCSEQGIQPPEACEAHLEAFGKLMKDTCLRERADRAVPRVAKAWRQAQREVPGWPEQQLSVPAARKANSSPPWSAYPASLEADARAFVEHGSCDDAEDLFGDGGERALRPATRENYLVALRRSAGELVDAGMSPQDLRSLADIVRPERVKAILSRVAARTRRKKGGQVAMLATVLFMAARDHVRLAPQELERLRTWRQQTLPERQMGDRTFARLQAFDDPAKIDALLRLPDHLVALAHRRASVDERSARLVRAALFLRLLLDTGARQGNVVALDLDSHVMLGAKDEGAVIVPGQLVKNGEEIRAPLRPATVRLLRLYVDRYRPVHAAGSQSAWLFPRSDGNHWTTTAAAQTLKELAAQHIGADVNPHLVRAVLGEIILQEQPGAIGLVKDVLGHRSAATSEKFYLRQQKAKARRLHQAMLDRRQGLGR